MALTIYSMRKLEQACRKNLDFIWLLQGERVPDHTSFARFRSGKARQAVEDLFYQFVKRLAAEQEIEYEEVFIDGTKIESMPMRSSYTSTLKIYLHSGSLVQSGFSCKARMSSDSSPVRCARVTSACGPLSHGRSPWPIYGLPYWFPPFILQRSKECQERDPLTK